MAVARTHSRRHGAALLTALSLSLSYLNRSSCADKVVISFVNENVLRAVVEPAEAMVEARQEFSACSRLCTQHIRRRLQVTNK